MFSLGKTRAFDEVENGHGLVFKLGTGFTRGRQIGAFLFRVLGQIRLGVALHKREAQCPPGQTNHWHPNQLLLEKELQWTNTFVEHVLQHHDVDPTLVVAGHKVGVLVVQAFKAFDVPTGFTDQVHPARVIADPRFVNTAHQLVSYPLRGREGQAQLENGHDEQRRATHDGVDRQQQRCNNATNWRRQRIQHLHIHRSVGGLNRRKGDGVDDVVHLRAAGQIIHRFTQAL